MGGIVTGRYFDNGGLTRPDDEPYLVGVVGLPKEKLLARLQATGRTVSPRQLERWWKSGHMDRPQRQHVVGLRGSRSVFGARAFDQAAALHDAAHGVSGGSALHDRRLNERAFLLWWSGKPIARDPRRLLLDFAQPMLAAIDTLSADKGTTVVASQPEDDDAIFDACERYLGEHAPERVKDRLLRAFFRNLGGRSDDMLSVMLTVASSVSGAVPLLEPSLHPQERSLAELVRKAFGFDEFGAASEPPETEVSGVLRSVAILANRQRMASFVLALNDEDLKNARRCARAFLEYLPAIFECQGLLFGRKATARVMRAFVSMGRVDLKAIIVIGLASLMQKGLGADALRLTQQLEQEAPRARALCVAARAFPEYRKLFSTTNLAKLANLPEETKRKILATLDAAIA